MPVPQLCNFTKFLLHKNNFLLLFCNQHKFREIKIKTSKCVYLDYVKKQLSNLPTQHRLPKVIGNLQWPIGYCVRKTFYAIFDYYRDLVTEERLYSDSWAFLVDSIRFHWSFRLIVISYLSFYDFPIANAFWWLFDPGKLNKKKSD